MAEVTIRILDNDNGNISLTIESDPAIAHNADDQHTEAQQLAMAFVKTIILQGVNNFIKEADIK